MNTIEHIATFLTAYDKSEVFAAIEMWAEGDHGLKKLGWEKRDKQPDHSEGREWFETNGVVWVAPPPEPTERGEDSENRAAEIIMRDFAHLLKCKHCGAAAEIIPVVLECDEVNPNRWKSVLHCDNGHSRFSKKDTFQILKELRGEFRHASKVPHRGIKGTPKGKHKPGTNKPQGGCSGCGGKKHG